jgi:hypothetical protein
MELWYKFQVTDNIAVTPCGVLVVSSLRRRHTELQRERQVPGSFRWLNSNHLQVLIREASASVQTIDQSALRGAFFVNSNNT